jgi:hypothetical protein
MVQILIEVLSTFCSSLRQGFDYKHLVFKYIRQQYDYALRAKS